MSRSAAGSRGNAVIIMHEQITHSLPTAKNPHRQIKTMILNVQICQQRHCRSTISAQKHKLTPTVTNTQQTWRFVSVTAGFHQIRVRHVSVTPAELISRSGVYQLRPAPAVWSPPGQIWWTSISGAFSTEQTGSHAPKQLYDTCLLFKIKHKKQH